MIEKRKNVIYRRDELEIGKMFEAFKAAASPQFVETQIEETAMIISSNKPDSQATYVN